MYRVLVNRGFWASMAVMLLCGLVLIWMWWSTAPVRAGDAALASGRSEEALDIYEQARTRLEKSRLLQYVFPAAYAGVIANRYHLLYLKGDYDTLLEETATAPDAGAAAYFWTGNAAYKLAMEQTEDDSRIAWLERAVEDYRNALMLESADWDIKYNLELSERLLAALRKDTPPPPKEMPELLQSQPEQGELPVEPAG